MESTLNPAENSFRARARQFARNHVFPIRETLDEREAYPFEVIRAAASDGLFRSFIPGAFNGQGGGVTALCEVVEELGRASGGVGLCMAAHALGAYPLLLHGTEAQQRRYLPRFADGDWIAAFALTEAGAGSDAGAVQTLAERDGEDYVLTGAKQWITNAGVAGLYTVIAATAPERGSLGLSAFLVEADSEGLEIGQEQKRMGIRASTVRELRLNGVRVPAENLLGREGVGFAIVMNTLTHTRPSIGALAVGIAQAAYEEALREARQRRQFGKSISRFQAIQHMLAEMATQIEAARLLVERAAAAADGESEELTRLASMAKAFASDVAMRVATDALQVAGGRGYLRGSSLERYMRDAKVTQIIEGTTQIQRNIIAAEILREAGDTEPSNQAFESPAPSSRRRSAPLS